MSTLQYIRLQDCQSVEFTAWTSGRGSDTEHFQVVLTVLADIYVSQPMNETFYSTISDQSTGLLGLLPRTVTLIW